MTAPDRYHTVITKDVMVPMRDGVRLAIDVYRPARGMEVLEEPLPVLLVRTSYDKSNEWMWVEPVCNWFMPLGRYVIVLQDIRGRYRSEGFGDYHHCVNPKEGADGYDTIEWIAAQQWCNGRIAMQGSSHNAIVQTLAALQRPPHLTAIWPDVGPTNIYDHMSREGGAMAQQMFGAIYMHAHQAQDVTATPGAQEEIAEAMRHMYELMLDTPYHEGQTALRHAPGLEQTLLDYYRRGRYDEYWHQECANQEPYFDRHADIPAVYSGGWYDPFTRGTTRYYAAMAERNRTKQRLIVGPWTHDMMRTGLTYAGDVDFGPEGVWGYDRYNQERLRFFDRYLHDTDNGWDDEPPVRIFVMGGGDGHRTPLGKLFHGGRWRDEREWPLARAVPTPFYLHPDGRLSPREPTDAADPLRYRFDPADPVPTAGGSMASFLKMIKISDEIEDWFEQFVPWRIRMKTVVPNGGRNQLDGDGVPLRRRADVLVFETDPLPEPIEVTGPVEVHLWVSSSAPDTDFTAKLVDVHPPNDDYPDGYDLNILDSIIRTRYREGWDREVMMEPGEVHRVKIGLPPTSNLFAAGHRIRVDVSSSNFPRFDLNPNTGEEIGRHTRTQPADQAVYADVGHPSHVVLPIVPPDAVPR